MVYRGVALADLNAMDEMDRHHLYQQIVRIRARERFEFIADLCCALSSEDDRRERLVNLAEHAYGDDLDQLQKVWESLTRK